MGFIGGYAVVAVLVVIGVLCDTGRARDMWILVGLGLGFMAWLVWLATAQVGPNYGEVWGPMLVLCGLGLGNWVLWQRI